MSEGDEGGRERVREMSEGRKEGGRERGRDVRKVNEGRGKVAKVDLYIKLVKCVS